MGAPEFTADEADRKDEFRRRGKRRFGSPGESWTAKLAAHFNVNERRVREWAADPPRQWQPVPDWLLDDLRAHKRGARTSAGPTEPPEVRAAGDDGGLPTPLRTAENDRATEVIAKPADDVGPAPHLAG